MTEQFSGRSSETQEDEMASRGTTGNDPDDAGNKYQKNRRA